MVTADGEVVRRQAVDSLRLDVAQEVDGKHVGPHVRVYVNDVEMTAAGAGFGMDPYDVLVPTNRLLATTQPHTIPIARCRCTSYSCTGTDVTITRDGDVVHWDWSRKIPMDRGVTFDATHYDNEVTWAAEDLSWETAPYRKAGRLVLTTMDRDHLLRYGLRPAFVFGGSEVFGLVLEINDDYQIIVKTPGSTAPPKTSQPQSARPSQPHPANGKPPGTPSKAKWTTHQQSRAQPGNAKRSSGPDRGTQRLMLATEHEP
ncbi:hypothetical protein GCM10029964_005820 [Kibdelosporangium lantanae]